MTHPTKSRSGADPASAFSVLLTSLKALERSGVEHKGLQGKIGPCLWRKELWAAAEPMRMGRWLLLAGLVVAALLPAVQSMGTQEPGDTSRWQPNAPQSARNLKRHSEGTFSSDLTRHLDSMRAKDFVHWLINTKRYSSTKRFLKGWPRSGSSESAPKAKVQ